MRSLNKYLSLIIVLSLVFLLSCNKTPEQEEETLSEYQKWLYSHPQGEYDNKSEEVYYGWSCPDFEWVMERITDVVKATYKTSWQVDPTYMKDPDYIHEFEVLEYLRGEKQEKTVYVYENPSGWDGHPTYDIEYEKGRSYLLLLRKDVTPFENGPRFTSVAYEMYLPLSAEGKIDLGSSRYCRYSLEEKIKDEKLKEALSAGNFLQALLEEIKENPYRLNYANIIERTDMKSVLNGSDHVVRVEISNTDSGSYLEPANSFCLPYNILVKSVFKGDCVIGESYRLVLPRDFKEGEYIVAMQDIVGGSFEKLYGYPYVAHFVISSKNSIYRVEAEENVKALLLELEK